MTYNYRGIVRGEMGDYEGAMADLNKAIDLNPRFVQAYTHRGVVKSQTGDLDGAISDHSKAIQLAPTHAAARYNRGCAKEKQGDELGALSDYQRAVELDPATFDAAWVLLGIRFAPLSKEVHEALGTRPDVGLLVAEITPQRAADRAGLKTHDILIQVNGRDATMERCRNVLAAVKAGQPLTFRVLREGSPRTIEVRLGAR
jgi:tetratricopeptide (TPR) repeat protein